MENSTQEQKTENKYDIIFITADEYVDHPSCGIAILKRVLEHNGFSVGIIQKPDWSKNDDFVKLGKPKLFFGITSGPVDSMLNNYTPLKKERAEDEHLEESGKTYNKMPDRAVTVYCNKIRELFKDSITVIGGVEASLRRFAHYDYWQNRVRKSILLDTRADILVYGSGEKQIIEIAKRISANINPDSGLKKKEKVDLTGIEGTCIMSKHLPDPVILVPSFGEVENDDEESKRKFCEMQNQFSMDKNIAQAYEKKFVVQYKYPKYTSEDLDLYYSFDYSRNVPKESQLYPFRFSVTTHRGCFGKCSFCSISLHQGSHIISRSEKSILDEMERITKLPGFDGDIDDLGGPSANMYGMDLVDKDGIMSMDTSHRKLIELMRKARQIPKVKKVFVQSGIRYDVALQSPEYVEELLTYHVRDYLMIAPEHFSSVVTALMNKPTGHFDEFVSLFNKLSKKHQEKVEWKPTAAGLKKEPIAETAKRLKYYAMVGHPGTTIEENKMLQLKAKLLGQKNFEHTQIFTPTPMTVSTCMYYTSMNPFKKVKSKRIVEDENGNKKEEEYESYEKIYVPYTYMEKKKQKNMIV